MEAFADAQGVRRTARIDALWSVLIGAAHRTFFLVRLLDSLPAEQNLRSPFLARPRFFCTIVPEEPSDTLDVIELRQIFSHVVVWQCPPGSFGFLSKVMVVCNSLNRGRKL